MLIPKSNMRQFLYKHLFIYSSLQSVGHVEEYFSKNTEKLVVYIVMPRLKNSGNFLRFYQCGKLVTERTVLSSSNIFLYYFLWYFYYIYFLLSYFSPQEKVHVFVGHPISLFAMSIQKLLRKVTFSYWIGDYFPSNSLVLILFEKLKKFYHDRVTFTCYLSDRINKMMNGKIIESGTRKTVMWGVSPFSVSRKIPKGKIRLLFVGLVKNSQGLEIMYQFLAQHTLYSLTILGLCDDALYKKHINILESLSIQNKVYFPNRFVPDLELKEISKRHHIGISLYTTTKSNPTYYTDPGKIKTYTELGLPVLMSDTSAIISYIEKFAAGEVVSHTIASIELGLEKIRSNYPRYLKGVERFNQHFYYESYYKSKFTFFEKK